MILKVFNIYNIHILSLCYFFYFYLGRWILTMKIIFNEVWLFNFTIADTDFTLYSFAYVVDGSLIDQLLITFLLISWNQNLCLLLLTHPRFNYSFWYYFFYTSNLSRCGNFRLFWFWNFNIWPKIDVFSLFSINCWYCQLAYCLACLSLIHRGNC